MLDECTAWWVCNQYISVQAVNLTSPQNSDTTNNRSFDCPEIRRKICLQIKIIYKQIIQESMPQNQNGNILMAIFFKLPDC